MQGKGNTSFYPVLNTVEAFVEKRIGITYVDAASTCSIASVIVALSVLAVAMLMH